MATKTDRRARPMLERFWSKVQKTDNCWIWTGSRLTNGYGLIRPEGQAPGERKRVLAHRVSWQLHYGVLPDKTGNRKTDICVLHHCDNPPCVRPDHLFLGTMKDNSQDMSAKGRARYVPMPGEKHPNAKLTWEAVRRIRELWATGADPKTLAAQYGVTRTLIMYVCDRKGWKE